MTPQYKKRTRRGLLGCLVLGVFLLIWHRLPITQELEQATLDYRYAHFNRSTKASDQVIVVDIDEQSIKLLSSSYGRWPWPRRIYKDLIEFLSLGEPSTILFDLLFTEPMLGSNDDRLFAQASQSSGVVSHAMTLLKDAAEDRKENAPLPKDFRNRFGLKWEKEPILTEKQAALFHDFLVPTSPYLEITPKIHVVSFDKDKNGIFRRNPMYFYYDKTWLPSLTLAAILSTLEKPRISALRGTLIVQSQSKSPLSIPLDSQGNLFLHYYKPENSPESIPFAAVLASALDLQKGKIQDPSQLKVNPFQLKGKIIVVGGSAAGLEDLKATPIHPAYPGVMLHATAISNILQQNFLKTTPRILQIIIGLFFLLATYYCVLFLNSVIAKVSVPLLAILLYDALAVVLFQKTNLWLNIAMPSLIGIAALFDGLAYITFIENAEKRKLTLTLSKYLSPAVTQKLIENGNDPRAEIGHHQELTILFSDIRGFTTFSEVFKPEFIVEQLNEYLGRMTGVIFDHSGTLDKFIGDAMMAFWGAPLEDPEHAQHAVSCAFAMQKILVSLNEGWKARSITPVQFKIGIGINTGKVIVGNIGSEKRLDYTVIGDNVNLASRIEGLTKQYHIPLLIGQRTHEMISKSMVCRMIDQVQVKGKSYSTQIYEPLTVRSSPEAPLMEELAGRFIEAWTDYQQGHFSKAMERFSLIQQWKPGGDAPSKIYVERCQELMSQSPKEWNGIYVAQSK